MKNNNLYQFLNLGWTLVSPILLGVFLGLYLDKLFQTKPICLLILIILGSGASLYNLVRISRSGK